MGLGIQTKCLYGSREIIEKERNKHFGAVSYPIYQSATFAHPCVGGSMGYDYSRLQNPTREHLEEIVAQLEHGADCIALSSGMAAVALVMELFEPQDRIIADSDLYGGSIRLFDNVSAKNKIFIDYADTSGVSSYERLEALVTENTKAVFIETPSNPMMKVTDIAAISEFAKKHGLLLIVDNTFLSPYLQNPIDLGADIVINSGTKFICGHNDTLAGFVISAGNDIAERLRFLIKTVGSALAPMDAWLVLRGLKTLGIRMDRQLENTEKIVEWLKSCDFITKINYPGLESHPGHEICRRQARGFGCMLSFETDTPERAKKILSKVRLIHFAESLGGVETLITYPVTQTHADVSEEARLKNGITDRLLRLSVGIEDICDLLEDLKQACS